MKKVMILFCILLIIVVSGCSQASSKNGALEPSTIQKIQDRKKIIVGMGSGDMPFHMKDKNNQWIGYEIDLINAMAKALNVDVEIKQYDFSALIPALQGGNVDMIVSGLTIRGDRALAVSFSDPYYSTGQVLMVPKNDTKTKSWKDLDQAGKTIAVSQGSTGALLAKAILKNAKVSDFDQITNGAMAVGQGQVNGLIFDETAMRVYELMYHENVRVIYNYISSENLGIAVKKDDISTLLWINSFLSSYKNGPEEIASRKKWFKSNDWLDDLPRSKQ